jgi:hypothetical protein
MAVMACTLSGLFAIAYLYLLLTLLAKGLGVTRNGIPPIERQTAILLGLSMMIIEIVVSGSAVYTIGLLFVYLLLIRLFNVQIDNQIRILNRQILLAAVYSTKQVESQDSKSTGRLIYKKAEFDVSLQELAHWLPRRHSDAPYRAVYNLAILYRRIQQCARPLLGLCCSLDVQATKAGTNNSERSSRR